MNRRSDVVLKSILRGIKKLAHLEFSEFSDIITLKTKPKMHLYEERTELLVLDQTEKYTSIRFSGQNFAQFGIIFASIVNPRVSIGPSSVYSINEYRKQSQYFYECLYKFNFKRMEVLLLNEAFCFLISYYLEMPDFLIKSGILESSN